ncbi:uncharacterized protein LOC141908448 [Tubulanus polymorphus]|uniref:uncharacterized protein LOC141908448 n=1 Tax=Tubulanus polymorphus TaxID=672921 RepID=UPI003DA3EB23
MDSNIALDLGEVCDGNMMKLVTSLASNFGVADEYIFYPLLSCVGAVLGRTQIRVNETWTEKCCVWLAVGSQRGSRKTSVLSHFTKILRREIVTRSTPDGAQLPTGSGILRDYMDACELESFYKSNPPCAISLFEDGHAAFKMFELDKKPRNKINLERFHDAEHFETDLCPVYNIFAFIGDDIVNFFERSENPLWDRFVFTSPREKTFFAGDFKVPIATNTPDLSAVLKMLYDRHCPAADQSSLTYTIAPDTVKYFQETCDEFTSAVKTANHNTLKCLWRKSAGQLVRLACLFKALRQALKCVVYKEEPVVWPTEITTEDFYAAKLLVVHSVNTISSILMLDIVRQTSSEFRTPSIELETGSRAKKRRFETTRGNNTMIDGDIAAIAIKEEPLDGLELAIALSHHAKQTTPSTRANLQPTGVKYERENSAVNGAFNIAHISDSYGCLNADGSQSPTDIQTPEEMAERISSLNIPDVVNGLDQQPVFPCTSFEPPPMRLQPGFSHFGMVPFSDANPHTTMTHDEAIAFSKQYAQKLRKLLEFNLDYRITPSVAAQRHLMPPLSKSEMEMYNTPTKYPAALGKEFLVQVGRLGFGTMETVTHPTNKKVSMFLEKRPYSKLGPLQRQIVQKLGITVDQYNEAFANKTHLPVYVPLSTHSGQNNGSAAGRSTRSNVNL